ncbi:beta-ketoacyl synthase N-terminal-like domain-containing protein [Streptomyces sp. NPDC050085]|uniref:beta-ketoacyl synthase N-terminal-like domain-containing protein n=1 Tax=Streptomyces sp. NPDC050085 TaxID=3365600 RepID=UPI00379E447A
MPEHEHAPALGSLPPGAARVGKAAPERRATARTRPGPDSGTPTRTPWTLLTPATTTLAPRKKTPAKQTPAPSPARTTQCPVAVVGMAVTFPGAADLDTYWRNIATGTDSLSDVPSSRWDTDTYYGDGPGDIYCRRGGFVDGLPELAAFDPTAFGLMPGSVPATEPDQLIALRTAAEAIRDAGGPDRLPDPARVGVILGRGGYLTAGLARLDQRVRTAAQLTRTLRELLPELPDERLAAIRTAFRSALAGPDTPESVIGLVPNFAASRIANRLDLRGPAYTVDAACASSLVALDHAVAELASGRCDVMLAGGVHHCHDITLWSVFAQLKALSPSQRSRPFHKDSDGVLMGEGTGVVVLKRLDDALRDGDRIYSVVRGIGVAGDGRAASLVNPDPGGQARAVRLAWQAAGLDPKAPDALGLLEAHGTGTPNGDGAELATLADVFGTGGEPDAVIGTVKSLIGHTMPAAGVAGLIKASLAIHHGVLPPAPHCDDPHPDLLPTRFRPLPEARQWTGDVRRAAVNAFGFGGINAHVILEQPPTPVRPPQAPRVVVNEPPALLRLAADTPQQLAELLTADDATLRRAEQGEGHARLAVLDPTPKRLALARKATAAAKPWPGRTDVWHAPRPLLGPAGGKVAYLYPGLEAEYDPQLADVAAHFKIASPARTAAVGDVGRHGAAVVETGRFLTEALRRAGITPDAVAGHSVGEWTAMVAGGMFTDAEVDLFLRDFDPTALRVPGLAFGAFGAPASQVEAALTGLPGVVVSHDNAPRQSLACGPADQVETLTARLRAEGVLGQVLPFESGFHTPMLAPYVDPIRRASETFTLHAPHTPVWSGTTAAPFPPEAPAVRALFVRHLLERVRFRELTESLYAAGFRAFVQPGVGQLPALVGDTLATRDHLAVTANSARHTGMSQLLRVAAALWTYGTEPDFSALRGTTTPRGATSHTVPIDLGAGLVTLDKAVRDRLRLTLGAPGDQLAPLATDFPVAAELQALLAETATAATELFKMRPEGARDSADMRLRRGARPATTKPHPPTNPPPADAKAPTRTTTTRTLQLGVDTHPYLQDHCFFQQPPNWPDIADRWPIVPATTIVQLMTDAVPGTTTTVKNARFQEWVVAQPPTQVTLETTETAPGTHDVTFDRYARATLVTAAAHPAPPAPWPAPTAPERRPTTSAQEMYDERWMFHGPLFRGVTHIEAVGDRHVRGTLTTPPAPGALLDNVGQLLGYWLMATHTDRTVVFPVGIQEARFHGPHPAPGAEVTCDIRVTALTETVLEADVQLIHRETGTVWAEITGWQDRRFDSPARIDPVKRRPAEHTLSDEQPGGWQLVFEYWPDPASRDLMMRNQLAGDERRQYAEHPPRGRRQWFLGRIAAKDAVRRHLWKSGEGPVFPGEVRIRNKPTGAPAPEGVHGRELPPLALSLAHCAEAGVALARPVEQGPVGIDVEEITERPEATYDAVLAPTERPLFEELTGLGTDPARVLTRFWSAKEAAAKAEGTGLQGRPRDFLVTDLTGGDTVTVRGPAPAHRTHHVRLAETANPPGLPPRSYVVAWTVPPVPDPAHEETP